MTVWMWCVTIALIVSGLLHAATMYFIYTQIRTNYHTGIRMCDNGRIG